MSTVNEGDRVVIHYTGRRQDGTVFETSRGREPVAFIAGSAELIEGLSRAVVGMAPGQTKTVTVSAELGYGLRRPGRERRVPRRAVPANAAVGDAIEVSIGDGLALLWVKELGDDYAILDPNHPLAGEALEIELEVMSVEPRATGPVRPG